MTVTFKAIISVMSIAVRRPIFKFSNSAIKDLLKLNGENQHA